MINKAMETWKSVIGYEGLYEAGSKGNIRSLVSPIPGGTRIRIVPIILKPKTKRNGYLEVGLNKNKVKTMCYVHRLVLEAFGGVRPRDMECGHIDGNKKHNAITNLCWLMPGANIQMAVDQGSMEKGERRHNAILDTEMVRKIRSEYSFRKVTHKALAAKYGVTHGSIQAMLSGRTWGHVKEEICQD